MLKITLETGQGLTTLQLEGKLAGPWVEELQKFWRSVRANLQGVASLRVDLAGVSFIDEAGRELLAGMYDSGAELVASGCLTRAAVEEIQAMRPRSTAGRRLSPPRRSTTLLAFFFLLVGVGETKAQEKAATRLTLRDAVQLALKQNPEVQIATLQRAQSEQDRSIARAALLPQGTLQVADSANRFNIQANFGRRIAGFPQHAGPFEVFHAGSGFSMPVFDLALWRRWQASRRGVEASDADRLSVREQTVLLVASQYLTSLRATANVRAAESRVQLAQALYDQAADLQKQGVGTAIDTLRANVELQNEVQRRIVAETDRRTSLYGLSRLLNLDPHEPIELADELSFFETPEFEAAKSIELALENRPEMKALLARDRQTRAERQAASESRLPALHFDGNWAQEGISASTVIPVYLYRASLAMPIFTGGRIHAQIIRDDLELKKIEQQEQALRNQIALEVKTAVEQLESARHEVEVAALGVNLAEAEVEQARDRFRAGVASTIETITAQDELARANDNQIAALYRYNQARADLSRATGQMESLYVK